jgi:hypothetical protein
MSKFILNNIIDKFMVYFVGFVAFDSLCDFRKNKCLVKIRIESTNDDN